MVIRIKKSQEFTDILQRNLKTRCDERKRTDNTVHVSDILPTTCIRKQYYSRKFPDKDFISNEMVHHFVRGESSEFVITQLADIGVAQANIEMDGIVAHPDIMTGSRDTIVELKDTINGKRLDFYDDTFRAYLRQLLYYLIMTGIEKGIISIRYNIRELKLIKRDETGEYYFRPNNAKSPGIESWSVNLPKDDITREILRNEMVLRKNILVNALENHDVTVLPRLTEPLKSNKCPSCPFYRRCYDEIENERALAIAQQTDILDIRG